MREPRLGLALVACTALLVVAVTLTPAQASRHRLPRLEEWDYERDCASRCTTSCECTADDEDTAECEAHCPRCHAHRMICGGEADEDELASASSLSHDFKGDNTIKTWAHAVERLQKMIEFVRKKKKQQEKEARVVAQMTQYINQAMKLMGLPEENTGRHQPSFAARDHVQSISDMLPSMGDAATLPLPSLSGAAAAAGGGELSAFGAGGPSGSSSASSAAAGSHASSAGSSGSAGSRDSAQHSAGQESAAGAGAGPADAPTGAGYPRPFATGFPDLDRFIADNHLL